MKSRDIGALAAEDFEPLAGDTFVATLPHAETPLRLAAVDRFAHAARDKGGFALTFVGAPGPFAPQAIYTMDHEQLGRMELFLVPLGPRDGGNVYEAIFA